MARILAVHRYFYPDAPPYAAMLRRIVQRWAEDGHNVDVLTSKPSYRASRTSTQLPRVQRDGHITVRRLRLPREAGRSPIIRLANAVRLSASVFSRVVSGHYDVVMVSTVPPVVLGVTTALAARLSGTRLIYHCMDLHPEIGRLSGEFANPRIFAALMALDQRTMRVADPVVVLSEDMAAAVQARPSGAGTQVAVRNNFALPSETTSDVADTERTAADLWASLDLPEGAFTLLFAGNIGRFQGLEDAVQALAQTRPGSDVHLVLMGDGTAVQSLRDLAENVGVAERVHFLGLQSVSVAREVMRLADAGLVSLQPDVIRFAYPSKTATYAEQGMVLVVVVEPDSVLAREVRESGAGIVVAPGDVEGLATEMSRLAEKSEGELQHMSTSAQALAHRDFEEAAALQWWSDLVRESR
jgi:colanic acid biosynthesis glycosyl transferase WcaI